MPQFRDPVHGFVYISSDEQKIIDSYPFQRLRNIRQLATTYLVYHGAEHTRFGHSIGVMHLVTRAFDCVASKTPNLFRENSEENEAVIIWYRQILRLIALTHDLGHPPFSHASEDLFSGSLKHEDYTKKILEETVISDYINEIGQKLQIELAEKLRTIPDKLIEEYNIRPITPQLLWMIYGEKPSFNSDYIWPDFVFLKSFMDSELDCDKMDYLLRDSLYCGVTYGKYDIDRFISSLTVYKNTEEKILSLAISSGGIQAFEEFVLARYFMFIQVYFHKTRRYFDRLLVESMKEILPGSLFPEDIEEYLKWDDVRSLNEMRVSDKPKSQQYLAREAMTCVFETPAHTTSPEKMFTKMLYEIMEREFPNTQFLYDDIDKKAHKLLPTTYTSEDESGGLRVIDRHTKEPKNVMDCTLILRGIIENIFICRLYATADDISAIRTYVHMKYSEYSK